MMGILFFIGGQVTAQTISQMPIRTADPHPPVQRAVSVALPIRSGGGEKTLTSARPGAERGAVRAILPPMRAGSTTGPGANKPITGGAGSPKLPVKGTGTGVTNKQ
jgi:hypothetical protein